MSMREEATPSVRRALAKLIKRIAEGFDGEVTLRVKRKGIAWMRWSFTETGEDMSVEENTK